MATVNRITKAPYRVDFNHNINTDRLCGMLIARGCSNAYIIRKTGLRPTQISYRVRSLKAYGVSRMDTRNGVGRFAKIIEKATEDLVESQFQRQINRGPQPL